MIQDFDITQISKDTKVIVFRVPFSLFLEKSDGHELLEDYCNNIGSKLNSIGIKSLFIDDSTEAMPLTDELLSIGNIKQFNP